MRDWDGSRVRADALLVPCLYCGAVKGELCRAKVDGKVLEAFPAHQSRIKTARNRGGVA